MNREIKFRVYYPKGYGSKMSYFTLGDSSYPSNVMQFPVMQYTGLKDRNGKEIYEGDLVRVLRGSPEALANTYQIKYFNAAFQMWGKGNDIPTAFVTYAKHAVDRGIEFEEIGDLIEVIGNIHENPELL